MISNLLFILNARLNVLERPNRSIDQVHNATFALVSLKQITAVLKIDMSVQFSHTLIDVKLFAQSNVCLFKLKVTSALQNFDCFS